MPEIPKEVMDEFSDSLDEYSEDLWDELNRHFGTEAEYPKTNIFGQEAFDQAWDDGEWKESDHPRDKDGKFAPYATGSAMKTVLQEHGFQKKKQGGKFGTNKLEYHHPEHGKIVIEPPHGGAGQSSNFTHFHSSYGEKGQQGSGSHSLKYKLQKLTHNALALKPPLSSTPAPTSAQPAQPASKPTLNNIVNIAKGQGYELDLEDKTVPGGLLFKKGEAKIEVKADGSWIAKTPGHQAKQGPSAMALHSLLNEPKEKWEKHGVSSYFPPFSGTASNPHGEYSHKSEMTQSAKSKIAALSKIAPTPTAEEATAIGSYTGSGYVKMNDELRQGAHLTPNAKKFKSWLDRASIPEDGVYWRGVTGNYASIMKSIITEGMIFQERGFMSTSVREDFSASWGSSGILMKVNVKKGAKGASVKHLSHHSSEDEVVFQVGSRMKVLNFDFTTNRVEVELINE